MPSYAPIARIILRYIVGALVGADTGGILAGDPDLVTFIALGIGAGVEIAYTLAKKYGWMT